MARKTNNQALLVRAMYDFEDVQEGEIKLSAGDVISVSSETDENWWRGINLSQPEGSVGSFPKSFVKEITLPALRTSDKLLLSSASFQTNVAGDLNFEPNEVIVLESCIDQNWCQGTIGSTSGIFPKSFTKEIHLSFPPSKELLKNGSNFSCLPSANHNKPLAVGLAVVDFDARFYDEISFRDGDTIEIFEIYDASLALGSNKSNPAKVGQFPLEFVYIPEGEKNCKITTDNRKSFSKFDWWKKPEAELHLKKKQQNVTNQIVPSFEEQTAPLTTLDSEVDDDKESDKVMDGDTSNSRVGDVSNRDREEYQERNEIIAGNSSSITCFSTLTETNVSDTCETNISLPDETKNDLHNFVESLIANIPIEISSNQNLLGHLTTTSKESPTDEDVVTSSSGVSISLNHSNHESNAKVEDESWKKTSLSSSPMPPPLPLSLPPPLSPISSSSLMFLLHADDFTENIQEVENCEMNDDDNNNNNGNNDEECSDNEESKCSSVVEKEPMSLKDVELPSSPVEEVTITLPQSSSEFLSPTGQTFYEDNPVSPKALLGPLVVPKNPSKPKPPAKPPKPKPSPRLKKVDSDASDSSRAMRDFTENCLPQSNQNVCNDKPKPPPASNKPKVKIESKLSFHKTTNSGRGGFLFKSGPSFVKRKSTFYVDSFLGTEVEAVDRPDASEVVSPSSDVHLTLGSVVTFKKISGKSEDRDECKDVQNNQEFVVPSGCSVNGSSQRKQTADHPVIPDNNLSGAGALMTGPLDPCHLISSPHSSPHKNDSLSSESPLPKKCPPVPLRPAPPKPTRSFASKNSAQDKTGHDIRSNVFVAHDDEAGRNQVNDSIIEDIEKRISETEQDLEKCIMEQSTILNEKYERMDFELSQEATENLKFYQANILGLTDELTQLRAILKEIRGEEDSPVAMATSSEQQQTTSVHHSLPPSSGRIDKKIARRRKEEQRRKAVDELVQTELIFLQAVCTCYDIFFQKNPPIECPPSVDLEFLFGNMHEVIDLSQKFYNLLEAATNGKDFHEQVVGSCFEEVVDDLKRVHGVYCRNHDEVISALTRLESNKEAQAYFQEQLNILRGKMMVFDLAAILIKPVQRIMKYPLLVGELIKYTEEDHPDYKHLRAAEAIMKEVAVYINEYKRRKDLVFKYKRPIDGGFSKKISKLTVHSIKKKFNRFMTPAQSLDESFQLEENKFKEMNIIIRCLIRDVNHYLDFLQVSLMDLESFSLEVSDHCREDHLFKMDLLCMDEAYSRLHNHICHQFKEKVENDIIPVLGSLLVSYQGPREVIRKRQHKLLDFDNALNKFSCVPEVEQTKLMKDELDFLRRTYEAMNSQLLEDLPKLYQLSVSIVKDCIQLLARYQVEFVSLIKKELLEVLSLGLFQSSSSSTHSTVSSSSPSSKDIMNEFALLHLKEVDRLSKLSFIPRSFNPSKTDRKSSLQPLAGDLINSNTFLKPQSEDERTRLKKCFQADKLYVVTKDFDGGEILDLCLTSGTLVGVIKEEDPMKNKERFFVCSGAQQGFVLRSHLKPFEVENLVEISEEGQPNKAIYDISNDNDDNSLSASSNLVDCADEGSCEVDSDEDVIRHDDVDDNDACKEKLGADDNDISENKDSKTGQ